MMNAFGIAFNLDDTKDSKIKRKFDQLKKDIGLKKKNLRNLSLS